MTETTHRYPLLWSKTSVRKVYKDHGVWPTWIGSKYEKTIAKDKKEKEEDSKSRLPLPVLLWPEQKTYIDKCESIKEDVHITGKRKREDDTYEENVEIAIIAEEDEAPKAKKAKPQNWSIFGFLSKIWNRLRGRVPDGVPDETPDTDLAPVDQKDIESPVSLLPTSSSSVVPAAQSSITSTTTTTTLTVKTHSTNIEQESCLRAEVFAYFQKDRVYLIGPADVFGGDYALYRGVSSPDDAHSIATVQIRYTKKIAARDILAFCRLQNQVAKSAVFAYAKSSDTTKQPLALTNTMDNTEEGTATNMNSSPDNNSTVESSPSENRIGIVVLNFRSVSIRV